MNETSDTPEVEQLRLEIRILRAEVQSFASTVVGVLASQYGNIFSAKDIQELMQAEALLYDD